jgi:uncharacterized protein YqeY
MNIVKKNPPSTTDIEKIALLHKEIRQLQDSIVMYNATNSQDSGNLHMKCKSICEKLETIASIKKTWI